MAERMARAKLTPARLTAGLVLFMAVVFMFLLRPPGSKTPGEPLIPVIIAFLVAGLADVLGWERRGGRKTWRFFTIAQALALLLTLYGVLWRIIEHPRLFKRVAETERGASLSMWENLKFWLEPWNILFHIGIVFLTVFVILDLITPKDDENLTAQKITPFRVLDILFVVIVVWTLSVILWKWRGHFIPWYFFLEMMVGWGLIRRAIKHSWGTRGGRKAWRTLTVLQFISILTILAGTLLYHFPLGGSKSFWYDSSFICVDFGLDVGYNFGKYVLWPGIVLLVISVFADLTTRRKER